MYLKLNKLNFSTNSNFSDLDSKTKLKQLNKAISQISGFRVTKNLTQDQINLIKHSIEEIQKQKEYLLESNNLSRCTPKNIEKKISSITENLKF